MDLAMASQSCMYRLLSLAPQLFSSVREVSARIEQFVKLPWSGIACSSTGV